MLNTSKKQPNNIPQNNIQSNNSLRIMANETLIDKTMREIDEKTNTDDKGIIETFHSLENNIFNNINNTNNVNTNKESFKIDNFNLNEITQKYSDSDHFINIHNGDRNFLVSINEKLNKISIFNDQNIAIGYFTISHIAKYLGDIYDTKKQFLTDLDIRIYIKAKELIKTLLFKLKYNKMNRYVDIIIHDYSYSGFMGDIELLIKLNNMLYKYQKEQLHIDLAKVDQYNKIKIEQTIKKFIFMLLNYTLQLIAIMSDKVSDVKLKENLMNYSVGVVHRINLFVQEQLKVINNQNLSVNESLKKNLEVKQELKTKLDGLIENIRLSNKLNQKNKI